MDNFKVPYPYKGQHHCEVVVLFCMDHRYARLVQDFIYKRFDVDRFDPIAVAGGAKTVNDSEDLVDRCFGVSRNLHEVKTIVIVNHSDCGAYGGRKKFATVSEEDDFHYQELNKAKAIMCQKFSDKEIIAVFARLNEEETELEFIEI